MCFTLAVENSSVIAGEEACDERGTPHLGRVRSGREMIVGLEALIPSPEAKLIPKMS